MVSRKRGESLRGDCSARCIKFRNKMIQSHPFQEHGKYEQIVLIYNFGRNFTSKPHYISLKKKNLAKGNQTPHYLKSVTWLTAKSKWWVIIAMICNAWTQSNLALSSWCINFENWCVWMWYVTNVCSTYGLLEVNIPHMTHHFRYGVQVEDFLRRTGGWYIYIALFKLKAIWAGNSQKVNSCTKACIIWKNLERITITSMKWMFQKRK